MAYEIYYIELWHIFSVLFFIVINYYIFLHARKNVLLYTYLAVEGLLLLWLVAKILKTVSPGVDIRWFFIVLQYFGNCFLGAAFFSFAYTYAKGCLPPKKILLPIGTISLFFFLCMATNPLHMKFYSYYDFYRDSFGPLFYIHQTYSYAMLVGGVYLCAKQFFQEYRNRRMLAVLISAAVMIPLTANVFYILKLFKLFFGFRPLFDMTPITCNISLVLFAVATFRFRFFDTAAIAWRTVFDRIPEGIMLLNHHKRITDTNQTARVTGEAAEILRAALDYSEHPGTHEFLYQTQIQDPDRKYYRAKWTIIQGKRRNLNYRLRFHDETIYRRDLQTLEEKNQILQRVHEILEKNAAAKQALTAYRIRNEIGREVHDVLGHSVVLALSLLEVARICIHDDFKMSREKAEQAEEVIRQASAQMEDNLFRQNAEPPEKSGNLIAEMRHLIAGVRNAGHDVNITIQGNQQELPGTISDAILRLCQEAITNALRHGSAKKIEIVLRMTTDVLEVYVIDNGTGCSEIKKGFGLTGMEERIVRNLKGSLHFGGHEGGFMVNASIPLGSR